MGRKRHTPEQIITALREAEVGLARGKSVKLMSRAWLTFIPPYSRSSPRRSPRQPDRSIEELPLTFTHNSGLDLTYVPTWAGWLYLAVVLDAWSRHVVGWAMAPHMQAELVEGALAMAISRRQPNGGVVHHSDSEYLRAGSLRWSDPNTDRRS